MSAWQSHALVQRVLHKLLDLSDTLPVAQRTRPPGITLSAASAPELYTADALSAELAWDALIEARKAGWLRIVLGKSPGPGYADYERKPRVYLRTEVEPLLRQQLGRLDSSSPAQVWARAVTRSYAGSPDQVALLAAAAPIRIPGRSPEEIAARFNMLADLAGKGLFLREASSRMFWGLSKVLDNRTALLAGLLGQEEPFPESPIQLQVHASDFPVTGILFIENLTVFEAACRGRLPDTNGLLLVYGAGFKGSARRARTRAGSSLYYSRQAAALLPAVAEFTERWLYGDDPGVPVWFWGDLDYSGMAILRELRGSLPEVTAWEPGYAPMLSALEAGHGHAPNEAGKEGQADPVTTGCAFADNELLPAIRRAGRFVDQE